MAMTVVYNGVTMQNVTTRQWEQEIVYDESHTDKLFNRFHLRFQGICHAQHTAESYSSGGSGSEAIVGRAPAYIMPNVNADDTAVGIYQQIAKRMGESRKRLRITDGGEVMLAVSPRGESMGADYIPDLENGPHPRNISITHVSGKLVFRIEFTIDVTVISCAGTIPPVLSNRWSITEIMDDRFFTTRVIRGRLQYSGAVQEHVLDFKDFIVPRLEDGFRRLGVRYSILENQLEADYEVVDRQVHTAAPWPAAKMTARYTETAQTNSIYLADMWVRMDGSPEADKRLMLVRALQVIDQRIKLIDSDAGKISPQQTSIVEHIGEENAIEVHATFQRTEVGISLTDYLFRLNVENFGKPITLENPNGSSSDAIGYDQTKSRTPATYGYNPLGGVRSAAWAFLSYCYLQNPCNNAHAVDKGFNAGPVESESSSGGSKLGSNENQSASAFGSITEVEPGTITPPEDPNLVSAAARSHVYTLATMQTRYHRHCGRVQLPIAASGGGSGSSDTGDGDTCVVTSLVRPQYRREIIYEAERAGGQPVVPMPLDSFTQNTNGSGGSSGGGLRATLLKHTIRAHPPALSSDGVTPIYRVSASYLYALNRPPTADERQDVGYLPTQTLSQEDNQLTPEMFNSDMFLGGPGPTGSSSGA